MGRARNGTFVTFDMLRAFISLAQTLNLSETASNLSITRQTVKRHISDLEAFRGGALFTLDRQSYTLTQFGRASLFGARSLLRQSENWTGGERDFSKVSQFLDFRQSKDTEGRKFYAQQHPVNTISRAGTPLVQRILKAWGRGLGQVEHEAMRDVRPFLAIYRRNSVGWVCVEIGEHSAYARWFGWTWAKSAVGRLSEDDRAGSVYNDFIADTYERLYDEGGVRFDHLFAHLPRESSDRPMPVTFQRLLMGCIFPDDTPALAVLVSITENVNIDLFSDEDRQLVPKELIAEFAADGIH